MSNNLVFAWTAPGSIYPQYINVSRDGDDVRILVRSKQTEDNDGIGMGSVAVIVLPFLEAQRLGIHLSLL